MSVTLEVRRSAPALLEEVLARRGCIWPPSTSPFWGRSPSMVRAVTDFPLPDSPTSPRTSSLLTVMFDAV